MSLSTDNQPSMLVLALSAALIALTVSYSVDAEPLSQAKVEKTVVAMVQTPPAFEPPSLAPSAIILSSQPTYRSEEGIVKFYFAPSKTELAANAENALQEIAQAVKDGQRVQISGFHDETGNPQQNIVLSKKRAEVVQQRLIDLGAPRARIELKKPEVAVTTQDHAEARRVEVLLINQ